MYCMKCGKEIPEESKHCPYCGEKLDAVPAAEPVACDPNNILGLLAMIFGFVAIGTQALGVGTSISMPVAVAGLVCGFLAKNKSAQLGLVNTKAKTGIICSFAGIGVCLFNALLVIAFLVIYFGFFAALMAIASV